MKELKKSLTIAEYRENFGFQLKYTDTIFESKKSHISRKDWFALPSHEAIGLSEVITVVEEESLDGKLTTVYIVETIKTGRVYCYLIESVDDWQNILTDGSQHILKVHRMYRKFWRDHIQANMIFIN